MLYKCFVFAGNGVGVRKWNESGFRPPLCTYRLNWARRTSWGWWNEWDDTVLQTQDSKFEPWWSEAEHATYRSWRFPTILTFTRGWGRNIFVSFTPPRPGTEPRTLAWKAAGGVGVRAALIFRIRFLKQQHSPDGSSVSHALYPFFIWVILTLLYNLNDHNVFYNFLANLLKYFCINTGDRRVFLNLKSS